ncbi:Putative serine/threonine-protein kinase, active [Septoria linicola]|uniref:Serine/threonine-protein kinase, active n=1 Tax=Septoria linicola TaxID=215465 RepID=A0A9Q9EKM8_9PEZI|nr:Putative serine/threonine-protein kinase, active [Septoria linicola]
MRSEDESLQRFDRRLRSNPGLRLRRRLFRFASEAQCVHDEETRAGTPLPQQCLTCVASTFRDCVRWKFRLQSVKTVRRSDKIEDYFLSDINLPLVLEHEDQIDKPRKPGLRFSRCRIEPTHCQNEELTKPELFRKRFKLLEDDTGSDDGHRASEAENETTHEEKEALVALALGSLDHANIAKVLLAFREHADDIYLSLLFKREQHNLEEYLHESAPPALLGGFLSRVWEHTILLDHGLWRSLLGIVDAVATIHEVADGTIQTRRPGPAILGHFDIKPANILVGDGGTLLLTDFGQAAKGTVGTSDYAPPEHELRQRSSLAASYDVWSMACVLLQALIFIRAAAEGGGQDAVQTFYSQRLHETENNQSGAFWVRNGHGTATQKVLRANVDRELRLLHNRRHPKTKSVIEQLRAMLSIDPRQRPTIRECLKVFSSSGLGRDIFRTPGDMHIEPDLASWITSFTTEVQREPVPCRLQLYRTPYSRTRPPEVNLTLEYEGEPSSHSRTDIRSVHDVYFTPIALFDYVSTRTFSQSSQTSRDGVILKCAFANLFRGITLHFFATASYLEFITLMSHQLLIPDVQEDRSSRSANIRFKSCKAIEYRGWHRNEEHEVVSGVVQIWETLSPEAYQNRYAHVDATIGHEPPRRAEPIGQGQQQRLPVPPPAQASRYKMAVFGYDKETKLRTCLIADIGTDSYTIESKSSTSSLEFTEKGECKFRSVVYRAQDAESYPSFPISPDVLTTEIKEKGMRTSRIFLELETDLDHHRELRRLIVGRGIPVKQV